MTNLVIRGGTVVTAGGSAVADIAIERGVIEAIEVDLSGPATGADRVIDANGLLVLPGAVDVHTHTRIASDEEPDRFFQDSVAAAFGGTTTFLAFNNPGTGSIPPATLTADRAEQWRASVRLGNRLRPLRGSPASAIRWRSCRPHRRRRRDVQGFHGLRLRRR